MHELKRFESLMLCIGFVLVLTVSSAYIIHEADHDCIGEGCDICEQVAAAEALLNSFVLLGFILLLVFRTLSVTKYSCYSRGWAASLSRTLVGLRVRLND